MTKILKHKTIFFLLSILTLSFILLCNSILQNNETNIVDINFKSGVIVKNAALKEVVSPIIVKGSKNLKFSFSKMKFERTLKGKITLGDTTYYISNCTLIKDNNVFYYFGSLVNSNGEGEISFALGEELKQLSLINYKSETVINAPASTIYDFNLINSQLYGFH